MKSGLRWLTILGLALAAVVARAASAETWVKIVAADFTVLTPLREKEATVWAAEFAQYMESLRGVFPHNRTKLAPLTMVLFGRERDFAAYRPLASNGKAQPVAGFFARHESWAVAGLSGFSAATRSTIFHEGVHWFFSGTDLVNPVWLEEGVAEVFSTFRVANDRAEWGRPLEGHVALLQSEGLPPLERTLFTARGDLFGDDSLRTSLVYAQSWVFVHFLIFGRHDIPRSAFTRYASTLHRGGHPDETFRAAFGRTYAEFDRLLKDYIESGTYFVGKYPLAAAPVLKTEKASASDVQHALGRLALVAHRAPLALTHARTMTSAAPEDPRGYELLGEALKATNDAAGATTAFATAVRLGSTDFEPYFETARVEQNAAALADGVIEPAAARRVVNRYEQAINLHPRFRGSYENLAGVIGTAHPLGPEDKRFLEQGAQLFPESPMIQLGLAQLEHRGGDKAAARTRLDRVLATLEGNSGPVAVFARRIDTTWTTDATFTQINEMAERKEFAAALAYVETQLARGAEVGLRVRLNAAREGLKAALISQQLTDAVNAREWAEARSIAARILESAVPPSLKTYARRTLEGMDAGKFGSAARKSKEPTENR